MISCQRERNSPEDISRRIQDKDRAILTFIYKEFGKEFWTKEALADCNALKEIFIKVKIDKNVMHQHCYIINYFIKY